MRGDIHGHQQSTDASGADVLGTGGQAVGMQPGDDGGCFGVVQRFS